MERKDVELAIQRFRAGERPFVYRRPKWHLVSTSGELLPLKYIFGMVNGDLEPHTDYAKKAFTDLGYKIVELNGAGQGVRYWWVNHKKTYQDEHAGSYIWSPKTKRGNIFNQAYLNLTLVKVGDLVVSFAFGQVKALGIVSGAHREQSIPNTHANASEYWQEIGWMVPVEWVVLKSPITPKSHIQDLVGLLPDKYSPLQKNGNGNQSCYLASVSPSLGEKILSLLSVTDAQAFADRRFPMLPKTEGRPVAQRLPAEQLRKVTADYIWNAVQFLLAGGQTEMFGSSTDYDLLAGQGVRLAPKQVFGLAATNALGFSVKPIQFTAGVGTVCFELLEAAGYRIVPKGEQVELVETPINPEDREWAEGQVKLVYHLRRERSTGVSQAKKAAFINEHGRLYCEECLVDPVEAYGDFGEACIEVHHDAVQVADMGDDHKTTLDQLRCLCANCHRIEHRRLRAELVQSS